MARIRTARVLAAAASVPLAFALMSGVAQADNGGFANDGSNANVNSQTQGAVGDGANTNQANNANVNGHGNLIDQDNHTANVNFTNLWGW
ncbi:hypothetical protein [Streptomyces sp. HNM0574]|uniref:hypothetical protein n=1 Tax=Streptomyces sp. HNM0574 TaxID=2714954 RepID=UPI00146EF4B3|nr:hypothetical protein [Streptomyces sp. HNM0574]NLU69655.1 hypothetical protein [Streptomyces sp. HNM0574]